MEAGLFAKPVAFLVRFCLVTGIIGVVYGAIFFINKGLFLGINNFLNKSRGSVDTFFTKVHDIDSSIVKAGKVGAVIIIIAGIVLIAISYYLGRWQ